MTYQTDAKLLGPKASPRDVRRRGFVYFILAPNNQVKIGVARDPWQRLAALQVGSHEELRLVAYIPSLHPEGTERNWHKRFAGAHIRGEWFDATKQELAIHIVNEASRDWDMLKRLTDRHRGTWRRDIESVTWDDPGASAAPRHDRHDRLARYKEARGIED